MRKLTRIAAATLGAACIGFTTPAVHATPISNTHGYVRFSLPNATTAFYYVTTAGDLHHAANNNGDAINREAWLYFDGDPINGPIPQYYIESGLTDGYAWFYDATAPVNPGTGPSSFTYWNGFFVAVTYLTTTGIDEQDDWTLRSSNPTGSHTVEFDQVGIAPDSGQYEWDLYLDGSYAFADSIDLNFQTTKGQLAGIETSDTEATFQSGVQMSNLSYTDPGTGAIFHPGAGNKNLLAAPTGWDATYDPSTGTITFTHP